jgi:hypothetical protein
MEHDKEKTVNMKLICVSSKSSPHSRLIFIRVKISDLERPRRWRSNIRKSSDVELVSSFLTPRYLNPL